VAQLCRHSVVNCEDRDGVQLTRILSGFGRVRVSRGKPVVVGLFCPGAWLLTAP
jgi:hypothetical protein